MGGNPAEESTKQRHDELEKPAGSAKAYPCASSLRGVRGAHAGRDGAKDGRVDVVIPFDDKIIIIEFKFANTSKEVDKKRAEGQEQAKRYAESYKNEGKKIITVVLVADNEKKQVVV